MTPKTLSVQERKDIFLALVQAQDEHHNVRKSYQMISEQFGINERQLRQIEEEGLEQEWPPLCEAAAS